MSPSPIAPRIIVRDLDAAVRFYEEAFGFRTRYILRTASGEALHAELDYEGTTLILGVESERRGARSPAALQGTPVGLYVSVPDVDSHRERLRRFPAATVRLEPTTVYWGERIYAMFDPEGHWWTFATRLEELSPEEIQRRAIAVGAGV